MALIVQKYGGTSVGNPEKIKAVAERVLGYRRQGHEMVVVLSAMSGETDRLIGLAKIASRIRRIPVKWTCCSPPANRSRLLSSPWQLRTPGMMRSPFSATRSGSEPATMHTKARIKDIDTEPISSHLTQGRVVTIAGFQGVDEEATSPPWAAAAPIPRPLPWPRP